MITLYRILGLALAVVGVVGLFVPVTQAHMRIDDSSGFRTPVTYTVGACTLTYFPLGNIVGEQVYWEADAYVSCTETMSEISIGLELAVTSDGRNPQNNVVWGPQILTCGNTARCPLTGTWASPWFGPHPRTSSGHAHGAMEYVKLNGQKTTLPFPQTSFSCIDGFGGGMAPQP